MKTKNIFRTLLVAAALLMGANNVKAEEIPIGDNYPASGKITIDKRWFTDVEENWTLRIYLTITDEYNWLLEVLPNGHFLSKDGEFKNWEGSYYNVDQANQTRWNGHNDFSNGYIQLTIGKDGASHLVNGGLILNATGMNITSVTLEASGGGSTTESGELVDVNLGYYDYRTYVTPYVIDFSRSVGVEGYYAKEVSGNNIVFYQVTGKCASGVPLLLKKTDSASKLWKVTDTSVSGTTPDPNLLVAGNQTSPTVSGNNIYVLTYHNGGYVFAETEFQSADVDNQHAYLDLNSVNSGNARAYSIRFVKGNTTGINDIKAETIDSNVIYDLRGQRVERPTKGIYIINGKKVMIK